MEKTIFIINGPNLNLLGKREKDIYGQQTLGDIEELCKEKLKNSDFSLFFCQSNSESEIINWIQRGINDAFAIIINPAGFTHTSVAILDALLAIKLPTIEVHITNIYNREEFRKKSLISKAAKGIICGFGIKGYIMALDSIKEILDNKK